MNHRKYTVVKREGLWEYSTLQRLPSIRRKLQSPRSTKCLNKSKNTKFLDKQHLEIITCSIKITPRNSHKYLSNWKNSVVILKGEKSVWSKNSPADWKIRHSPYQIRACTKMKLKELKSCSLRTKWTENHAERTTWVEMNLVYD